MAGWPRTSSRPGMSESALRRRWHPNPACSKTWTRPDSAGRSPRPEVRGRPTPLEPGQVAMRLAADLARIPLVTTPAWLGARSWSPRSRSTPRTAGSPTRPGPQSAVLRAAAELPVACRAAQGRRRRRRSRKQPPTRRGATQLMLDALAPTNFLPTNPAALKRAFETGGCEPGQGARNFVDDLVTTRAGRARSTPAVQGGREPRRHAGQGRVPQRPHGAAPVRAADRAGARDARCCAARRGSTSTT